MVIDWEHHFTPKKYAEMVKGEERYTASQIKYARATADVQLKDMDVAGIDKMVLTGAARNMKECRIFNDEAAKWVKEHPDRFIGFAHVIPTCGDEALEELDRAIKDLGLKAARSCPV